MTNLNCGIEIKKETFLTMSEEAKDGVLFDYLDYLKRKLDRMEQQDKYDQKKLLWVAGLFGFFGGALVWIPHVFNLLDK